MRRSRIKVLATVPARKKAEENTMTCSTNNPCNNEYKEEDISSVNISEQVHNENIVTTNIEETMKLELFNDKTEPEKNSIDQLDFQEQCTQVNNDKFETNNEQSVEKDDPSPEVPNMTDTVSPAKVTSNRSCFMKPTLKLDTGARIRKNSIQGSGASASESEDDNRRMTTITPSRVRNDSICSVQSNRESTTNDSQNNPEKLKITPKKRMLISESARKLAEARKEFLLKHENKTPDRSQLKMYDLIYYNPVTNPMRKPNTSTGIRRETPIPQPEEVQEEEDEDDPSTMPVPQVKVGPDGQLIIDEKSLVIEQTFVKKNREAMSQEAIVDDNNHGSGFYKKRQKAKEWPKWETFKFYRALNVVGTDFLLMQSLFPNRTRLQIKQKYKKEERVNRHLIEKALKYHQDFDTEMLEKQLAMLQNFENIQTNTGTMKKSAEKIKSEQHETKKVLKRKRRLVATSIAECETLSVDDQEVENATGLTIDDETDIEANNETNNHRHQGVKKKRSKYKKYIDESFSDISDDNSSESNNVDSDSDPEIYQIRPTRSGRLPKIKKLRGPSVNNLDNNHENLLVTNETVKLSQETSDIKEEDTTTKNNINSGAPDGITNVISNINEIEPGSLVILSKESTDEPGNTILQVYMVSSNNPNKEGKSNITPIDLPPEILATVTGKMEDAESINLADDCEQ